MPATPGDTTVSPPTITQLVTPSSEMAAVVAAGRTVGSVSRIGQPLAAASGATDRASG